MTRKGLLRAKPGADARERVVGMTPKLRRMLARLEVQWAATDVAADRLNEELPHSLQDVVSSAISALERKPFAESITEYLRGASGDGHLGLDYSEDQLPPDSAAAEEAYSKAETERWYGAHLNYGFEKVQRLDGNVGYLDLRVFAPTAMAGDVAAAAMTLLAQSNALIIDLRNNGGGTARWRN